MDFQTLRTFLTLVQTESFSKTANVLFIAQSTVTKRIAELEHELGKSLFLRDRRNFSLTDEGQIFLQYATRILELEEASHREINLSHSYPSHLRVGTTNSIYECHLFPMLSQYYKEATHSLKITIGHSSELLHQLEDGLLDIVFSFLPFKKNGYECREFQSDELVLVTDFKNVNLENGIFQSDLKSINYLMCNFALQDVGQFIRELFPPYFHFKFEIDNSTKLLPYLLAGGCYSFLPKKMVEHELSNQQLRIIPLLDFQTPIINSYVVGRISTKERWEGLFLESFSL